MRDLTPTSDRHIPRGRLRQLLQNKVQGPCRSGRVSQPWHCTLAGARMFYFWCPRSAFVWFISTSLPLIRAAGTLWNPSVWWLFFCFQIAMTSKPQCVRSLICNHKIMPMGRLSTNNRNVKTWRCSSREILLGYGKVHGQSVWNTRCWYVPDSRGPLWPHPTELSGSIQIKRNRPFKEVNSNYILTSIF